MKIYSPQFFKDDFTINNNRFKNQENQLNKNNEKKVENFESKTNFKVVKIQKHEKIKKTSLLEKALNRVSLLKTYLGNFATRYFSEEVV